MNKKTGTARRWSWRALAIVAGAALAGGLANADVVLHPGTVTGTIGVSGTSLSNGWISISNSSFSASASLSGGSFSLTSEGGQTYNAVNWYGYLYTPNNQQIGFYKGNAGLVIPEGGTVSVDYSRPGGTLALHIDINKDPVTGQPLGSIASAVFSASASSGSESYYGYASGSGADLSMAMFASSSVGVYGNATVNVFDATGTTVACTTQVSFSTQTVSLAAGATVAIDNNVDVDPSICAAAVLEGSIGIHDVPGGVYPTQAYVNEGGAPYSGKDLTGFSAAIPEQTYEFDGLSKAYYSPYAYLYFPAPYSGDYLELPNQDPSRVDLTQGGTVVRDFVFEGSVASGQVALTGPAAGAASYGEQYFSGQYDYAQPSYGPSAGGYAGAPISLPGGAYAAVLTPGNWQQYSTYIAFSGSAQGVSYADYLQTQHPVSIQALGGQTFQVPTENLSVSEGDIVFDVIEPPGTPTIGITNPQVNAYFYDQGAGSSVSSYAYAYVSNAATPSVRLIGPPGTYNFDAYATVQGTFAKFASSTITIGTTVNTGTGSNVIIVPQDPSGQSTPVTLDFQQVTQGGETTASFTDVGPAAPNDYSLLQVISNARYLNITTSAQFTQTEVCIAYDPEALGVTSQQEPTLKLQEFVCANPSSCTWQVINGVFTGDNGGGAVNTATHVICGLTDNLGTFGITLPNVVLVPPTDSCIGAVEAPAQLATDPGVCSTNIDNTNQVAGGCAGGGGGLASCSFDGAASESLALGAHAVAILATANDGSTAVCSSYVDVVDRQAPGITCPAATVLECVGGTTPTDVAATCADNCGSCSVSCGNGAFPLGTTTVACNANDAASNKAGCTTTVTIVDTQAPAFTVSASPSILWPPNHKLVGITITKAVVDGCDAAPVVTCSVTSNEPDNGLGDGDTEHDVQWVDGNLLLRAERSGTGSGRLYTVTCTAKDASGNETTRSAQVAVPLSN